MSTPAGIRARLMVMMFLQFFIWGALTFGQMFEVAFLLLLPWFFLRLGVKGVLLTGAPNRKSAYLRIQASMRRPATA